MRAIINIDVPDLVSGIEFYTTAIGLIHARSIDNDVAELQGIGARFIWISWLAIYIMRSKWRSRQSRLAKVNA